MMSLRELSDQIPIASRGTLETCEAYLNKLAFDGQVPHSEGFLLKAKITNRKHHLELLEFLAKESKRGDRAAKDMATRCFANGTFSEIDQLLYNQYLEALP